jgi:hypothetical protein
MLLHVMDAVYLIFLLLYLMYRIDPVILAAKAEMGQASEAGGSAALAAGAAAAAAAAAGGATSPRAAAGTSPEARIKAREKALLPVYQQVGGAGGWEGMQIQDACHACRNQETLQCGSLTKFLLTADGPCMQSIVYICTV